MNSSSVVGASNGAHILGTLVPVEEPSTASKAVIRKVQQHDGAKKSLADGVTVQFFAFV
jgi:hypothetical protein